MKFNLSSKLHVNMNLTESLTGIVLKKATKFCKSPLEGVSKMLVVKTSERCQPMFSWCLHGSFRSFIIFITNKAVYECVNELKLLIKAQE